MAASSDWQRAGNVRVTVDGKYYVRVLVVVFWGKAIAEHCWRLFVGVENDVGRPI